MASFKLSNKIISLTFAYNSKYSRRLLVCNRQFCSKDNETKTEEISSEDKSCKKQEEHDKKASTEAKQKQKKAGVTAKASKFRPVSVVDESTKAAAKQKLMSLLSDLKIETDKPVKTTSDLNLAKAFKRPTKKHRLQKIQEETITPEKEMNMAVKAVASSFKDSEKIESELTKKLGTLNASEEALPEDVDIEDPSQITDKMNENLMSSVEEVASTISESPIPSRSALTKRLMGLSLGQKVSSEKKSVRSLIKGMTVEKGQTLSRPERLSDRKRISKQPFVRNIKPVNLFHAAPLNIFTPGAESKSDSNTFWQKMQERELRLLTQFAPANAFEEMIIWTEQGKHWKLPIDNEIDMGAEEKVGFHEHVFLDHHLKGFPTKGPVRHFMELVVVGLSKNPYITVDRKIENIEWFRTYFKEKEELLRDAGAID